VHLDPLKRTVVDTKMKPKSMFLDEAPVFPTIEEEVEDRESRYGLSPVRYHYKLHQHATPSGVVATSYR
jgi:hypothetical protein